MSIPWTNLPTLLRGNRETGKSPARPYSGHRLFHQRTLTKDLELVPPFFKPAEDTYSGRLGAHLRDLAFEEHHIFSSCIQCILTYIKNNGIIPRKACQAGNNPNRHNNPTLLLWQQSVSSSFCAGSHPAVWRCARSREDAFGIGKTGGIGKLEKAWCAAPYECKMICNRAHLMVWIADQNRLRMWGSWNTMSPQNSTRRDQVSGTFYGFDVDPVANLGDSSPVEPHVLADRQLKGLSFFVFVVRYVFDLLWWRKDEQRIVCLPSSYLQQMKQTVIHELVTRSKSERKPFIRDGDIICAWWTRLANQNMSRTSSKTVLIMNAFDLRTALSKDIIPSGAACMSNLSGVIYTSLPAYQMFQKPLR